MNDGNEEINRNVDLNLQNQRTQRIVDLPFYDPASEECTVCLDGSAYIDNDIIFCDKCNMAVHQVCYGVPSVPEGSWFCDVCKDGGDPSTTSCKLCPYKSGAFKLVSYGDDQNKELRKEKEWVHCLCATWTPGVYCPDTTTMPSFQLQYVEKARSRLRCEVCHIKHGACIQCAYGRCVTAAHAACALNRRSGFTHRVILSEDQPGNMEWEVFCSEHANSVKDALKPKCKAKRSHIQTIEVTNHSESEDVQLQTSTSTTRKSKGGKAMKKHPTKKSTSSHNDENDDYEDEEYLVGASESVHVDTNPQRGPGRRRGRPPKNPPQVSGRGRKRGTGNRSRSRSEFSDGDDNDDDDNDHHDIDDDYGGDGNHEGYGDGEGEEGSTWRGDATNLLEGRDKEIKNEKQENDKSVGIFSGHMDESLSSSKQNTCHRFPLYHMSEWPGQAVGEMLDLDHFWHVASMMYPEDFNEQWLEFMSKPVLEISDVSYHPLPLGPNPNINIDKALATADSLYQRLGNNERERTAALDYDRRKNLLEGALQHAVTLNHAKAPELIDTLPISSGSNIVTNYLLGLKREEMSLDREREKEREPVQKSSYAVPSGPLKTPNQKRVVLNTPKRGRGRGRGKNLMSGGRKSTDGSSGVSTVTLDGSSSQQTSEDHDGDGDQEDSPVNKDSRQEDTPAYEESHSQGVKQDDEHYADADEDQDHQPDGLSESKLSSTPVQIESEAESLHEDFHAVVSVSNQNSNHVVDEELSLPLDLSSKLESQISDGHDGLAEVNVAPILPTDRNPDDAVDMGEATSISTSLADSRAEFKNDACIPDCLKIIDDGILDERYFMWQPKPANTGSIDLEAPTQSLEDQSDGKLALTIVVDGQSHRAQFEFMLSLEDPQNQVEDVGEADPTDGELPYLISVDEEKIDGEDDWLYLHLIGGREGALKGISEDIGNIGGNSEDILEVDESEGNSVSMNIALTLEDSRIIEDSDAVQMRDRTVIPKDQDDEICRMIKTDVETYSVLAKAVRERGHALLKDAGINDRIRNYARQRDDWKVLEQKYLEQRVWKKVGASLVDGVRDQRPGFNREDVSAIPASWTLQVDGRPKPTDEKREREREKGSRDKDKDCEEDLICVCCFNGTSIEGNEILYCDGCNSPMHQACYGVSDIPEGDFFCNRCRAVQEMIDQQSYAPDVYDDDDPDFIKTPTPRGFGNIRDWVKCCLCPVYHGGLKPTVDGRWVHLCCAWWSGGAIIRDLEEMEPIDISQILPHGTLADAGNEEKRTRFGRTVGRADRAVFDEERYRSNQGIQPIKSDNPVLTASSENHETSALTTSSIDNDVKDGGKVFEIIKKECIYCKSSMGFITSCCGVSGDDSENHMCSVTFHPLCAWFQGVYICTEVLDPSFCSFLETKNDPNLTCYPASGLRFQFLCNLHCPVDTSLNVDDMNKTSTDPVILTAINRSRQEQARLRSKYRMLTEDLDHVPGQQRSRRKRKSKLNLSSESEDVNGEPGSGRVSVGSTGRGGGGRGQGGGRIGGPNSQQIKDLPVDQYDSSHCGACLQPIDGSLNLEELLQSRYALQCFGCNLVVHANCYSNPPTAVKKGSENKKQSQLDPSRSTMKVDGEVTDAAQGVAGVDTVLDISKPSESEVSLASILANGSEGNIVTVTMDQPLTTDISPVVMETPLLNDLGKELDVSSASVSKADTQLMNEVTVETKKDVMAVVTTTEMVLDSQEEPSSDSKPWMCAMCTSETTAEKIFCALCPRRGGAMLPTYDDRWAHIFCGRHVPGMTRVCDGRVEIRTAPKECWKQKCEICNRKSGVCIKCAEESCTLYFHPICLGRSENNYISTRKGLTTAYCTEHTPKGVVKISDRWVEVGELQRFRRDLDVARTIADLMVQREKKKLTLSRTSLEAFSIKMNIFLNRLRKLKSGEEVILENENENEFEDMEEHQEGEAELDVRNTTGPSRKQRVETVISTSPQKGGYKGRGRPPRKSFGFYGDDDFEGDIVMSREEKLEVEPVEKKLKRHIKHTILKEDVKNPMKRRRKSRVDEDSDSESDSSSDEEAEMGEEEDDDDVTEDNKFLIQVSGYNVSRRQTNNSFDDFKQMVNSEIQSFLTSERKRVGLFPNNKAAKEFPNVLNEHVENCMKMSKKELKAFVKTELEKDGIFSLSKADYCDERPVGRQEGVIFPLPETSTEKEKRGPGRNNRSRGTAGDITDLVKTENNMDSTKLSLKLRIPLKERRKSGGVAADADGGIDETADDLEVNNNGAEGEVGDGDSGGLGPESLTIKIKSPKLFDRKSLGSEHNRNRNKQNISIEANTVLEDVTPPVFFNDPLLLCEILNSQSRNDHFHKGFDTLFEQLEIHKLADVDDVNLNVDVSNSNVNSMNGEDIKKDTGVAGENDHQYQYQLDRWTTIAPEDSQALLKLEGRIQDCLNAIEALEEETPKKGRKKKSMSVVPRPPPRVTRTSLPTTDQKDETQESAQKIVRRKLYSEFCEGDDEEEEYGAVGVKSEGHTHKKLKQSLWMKITSNKTGHKLTFDELKRRLRSHYYKSWSAFEKDIYDMFNDARFGFGKFSQFEDANKRAEVYADTSTLVELLNEGDPQYMNNLIATGRIFVTSYLKSEFESSRLDNQIDKGSTTIYSAICGFCGKEYLLENWPIIQEKDQPKKRGRGRGAANTAQKRTSSRLDVKKKKGDEDSSEQNEEMTKEPEWMWCCPDCILSPESLESILGRKIKVWWKEDIQFYQGMVTQFERDGQKFVILYEDDDWEQLHIHKEPILLQKRARDHGEATIPVLYYKPPAPSSNIEAGRDRGGDDGNDEQEELSVTGNKKGKHVNGDKGNESEVKTQSTMSGGVTPMSPSTENYKPIRKKKRVDTDEEDNGQHVNNDSPKPSSSSTLSKKVKEEVSVVEVRGRRESSEQGKKTSTSMSSASDTKRASRQSTITSFLKK